MRAAKNGGKFWEHEPPTQEDLDEKYGEDETDMEAGHHRRDDSRAELNRHAVSQGDDKDQVSIKMQPINYSRRQMSR
jgi:hypothetical protein